MNVARRQPPFTRKELEAANAQFGPLDWWAWEAVMQWERIEPDWRWWFALLPTCVHGGSSRHWIWLEWYQYRFGGDHYEIRSPAMRND